MDNFESVKSGRKRTWIKALAVMFFSVLLTFGIGMCLIFADLIEFNLKPTVKTAPAVKRKKNSSYKALSRADQFIYDRLYEKMTGLFENKEKSTDFFMVYDEEWYEIKKEETGFNDLKLSFRFIGDLIDVARKWYYFNDFEVQAIRSLGEDYPYLFAWNSRSEPIYVLPHFSLNDFGIEIKMPVDTHYGDDLYSLSEEGSRLIVSSYLNAGKIVDIFKESDDKTKLMRYLESVLLFADYDYDAFEMIVSHTEDTPYSEEENFRILETSNIVNVFDGDPMTLSVCSGYSKSFQLLCDLSDFERDIECYCVGGVFYGFDEESGSGAHMWNIVKMNDGKKYLVDVTHSEPYQMGISKENITFLKGVEEAEGIGDFTVVYYADNTEYRCTYDTGEEDYLTDGYWFNDLSDIDYR